MTRSVARSICDNWASYLSTKHLCEISTGFAYAGVKCRCACIWYSKCVSGNMYISWKKSDNMHISWFTQELCIFTENVRKYTYFLKIWSDFYTDLLTGNFFHECICEYGERSALLTALSTEAEIERRGDRRIISLNYERILWVVLKCCITYVRYVWEICAK